MHQLIAKSASEIGRVNEPIVVSYYRQFQGLNYKTFFRAQLILYRNKIECLSLSVTSTQV
jgi:hypothetical protein